MGQNSYLSWRCWDWQNEYYLQLHSLEDTKQHHAYHRSRVLSQTSHSQQQPSHKNANLGHSGTVDLQITDHEVAIDRYSYYRRMNGAIIVYDVAKRTSF